MNNQSHRNTHSRRVFLGSQSGFSFIEVLVFVSIISFLFISLTATVITAVSRAKSAEYRIYATHYADILEEWLRAEKTADWDSFIARDVTGSGTVYCFNRKLDFADPASYWAYFEANDGALINQQCTNSDPTSDSIEGYDGIYQQQEGIYSPADIAVPRIFKRYAIITKANPQGTQVNVQIIVEWFDGGRFFSVPQNTVFTIYDEN